ncbi:MAG: DUF1109 domain-containing protein [Ancylobacter novellus]|uniref:DUF1109 domain-containing protein n=1 Tax=Ancylobacter novellus TaxID=921 RepID=A0A2W5KDM8_ANCNO|nr:MAG: DUF1109 domain-containing protein [Ancylobacter novellus]
MRTEELIVALSADAATPPRRLTPAFRAALVVAALSAGLVFAGVLGVRPDIAQAASSSPRFLLKFVLTVALGAAAGALAMRLARPGAGAKAGVVALLAVAALVVAAVAVELVVVPREAWEARLFGRNWLLCLVNVPLLSALPLATLLVALRRGAPDRPAALGAAAGLLAGSIGAAFYAAHCTDDSPLFVAAWYSLGIGVMTALGAALGARLLRW